MRKHIFLLLLVGSLFLQESVCADEKLDIKLIQSDRALMKNHQDSLRDMSYSKSFDRDERDLLQFYKRMADSIQDDIGFVWEAFDLRAQMKNPDDRMVLDLYLHNKKQSMKYDCSNKIGNLSWALPKISNPMIFTELNSLKTDIKKVCRDIEDQFKLNNKW